MLELDAAIAAVVSDVPLGTIDAGNLAHYRATQVAPPIPLSDAVDRRDVEVPGTPPVTVRVHRPVGADGPLPCVYSIHGGGYVLGSYDMDDARFDVWCPRYGCVGVSVEYRLAPETPYPGPLEDCYAGLKWVYDHHDDLGVDRDRIGVAGISAGGGLAAALALLARDRGEVPLRFQLLECPMLDDRQVTPSSQLDGLAIWSRESNTFGWRSYLGDRYGTDDVPAYAAAARATDLSGLPPAYVCVGNVDGFCDEDVAYATRLNQAGVPAELHVYAGAPHGVMLFDGTDVARRYLRGVDDWIGRQLAAP
ncbi:MAG TPA: alpha/beta hydrolase [Acidimicrobiales bacterium]|nr:alpha/beta hydrolase [Acidimicrobiales bacterium]